MNHPWSDDIREGSPSQEIPDSTYRPDRFLLEDDARIGPSIDTPSHDVTQILKEFFESAKKGAQFEEVKERAISQLEPYLKMNCAWKDKKNCVRDILSLAFPPPPEHKRRLIPVNELGEFSVLIWIGKEILKLEQKYLGQIFKKDRFFIGRRAEKIDEYLREKRPGRNLL